MKLSARSVDDRVLLAVSGGVDSVVMADLMVRHNCRFMAIAHCNFSLRGDESDGDELFVRELASRMGLECFVERFDTREFARREGISIEMAARRLRYEWFDRLCMEHGFKGVCVAHNANDNAETLVLNLLRGTGLDGVCGMDFDSRNPYGTTRVFRPLLDISRRDIEAYARENTLEWRTDSTNAENDCRRNIIRNEIFPLFERINPSFVDTLGRDISNFRMAERALRSPEGNARYALAMDLVEKGFNNATITDMFALMDSGAPCSGKQFHSAGFTAVFGPEGLVVRPKDDPSLEAPSVQVRMLPWEKGRSPRTAEGTTVVDASKLACEPSVRPWRDGDYLCPIGLHGRKKVSDILTALGYDILEKKNVMVLEGQGSHVLAVIGLRVDESVKVDGNTASVYEFTLTKSR